MFRKEIRVKSNTQVKGSERRAIREQILQYFPNLTEDDLNTLMPKKEAVNCLKVVTSSQEILQVYTVQKRPIFFVAKGKLFPTVYLLWRFPNLVYSFTTHQQVVNVIQSGADLMLPGVITSSTSKFGNVQEHDIVSVNTVNNLASIAVGEAAQSSLEMIHSGGRGKCVTVYHFYGDKLCNIEGQATLPIPSKGSLSGLQEQLSSYEEDFPKLGEKTLPEKVNSIDTSEKPTEKAEDEFIQQAAGNEDNKEIPDKNADKILTTEDMDELLYGCFFAAVKYSKSMSLPILTSTFYKLEMLHACPKDKYLDVRKSSFKKLKPFLDKMVQENLIVIKEAKKGVESIVSINKEHPKFAEFYLKKEDRPKLETENSETITSITESYIVTPSVLSLFKEVGVQKGDSLLGGNVRKHVRDYVMKHNCQNEGNTKLIKPDENLVKILKTTNPVTWEELFEKVCDLMKNCYKVSSGQEEFVNKGKVSPITINVANRSGNKKVTLVDNLELFGIHIPDLAKECQHGVAASTSISRPPGKKSDQLLIQGNQVLFVYNLLVDKYKIPKRYIKGLENAPKKKK